jgi:glycosyltransferase involved in cell wall biosynthesis
LRGRRRRTLIKSAGVLVLLSYAICTHDEVASIRALMRQLIRCLFRSRHPGTQYEIVLLDDYSQDPRLKASFRRWTRTHPQIRIQQRKLQGDFSAQKNALADLCKGDFIINLDADELVSAEWIADVPRRIEANPGINAYGVPRMNLFEGMTEEDLARYGYRVSEVGGQRVVNWPDTQWRIYRRMPELRWTRPVHEMITVVKVPWQTLQLLPHEARYAIRHHKLMKRVREATAVYDRIASTLGEAPRARW